MSSDQETKTCPDCAEQVLAAARKCRFCGYRFEPEVPRRPLSSTGGLIDFVRVPDPVIQSVPQLVDDWEVDLWPDEQVREDGLCFVELDGELGYVLVTSSRLRFIVPRRGRRKAPEVVYNRELLQLRSAAVERRRLRRVVVLRFDDDELVVHVETGPQEQLVDLVRAA